EVGDQPEGPTVDEHISRLPPAHIRIDPVDRRGGEYGPVMRSRQWRVLQGRIDELHVAGVLQVITRLCDQLITGFDRGHPQAPGEQGARELTGAAPDLEHRDVGPDTGHLTGLVDERVRVGRAMTVIFTGDLV